MTGKNSRALEKNGIHHFYDCLQAILMPRIQNHVVNIKVASLLLDSLAKLQVSFDFFKPQLYLSTNPLLQLKNEAELGLLAADSALIEQEFQNFDLALKLLQIHVTCPKNGNFKSKPELSQFSQGIAFQSSQNLLFNCHRHNSI